MGSLEEEWKARKERDQGGSERNQSGKMERGEDPGLSISKPKPQVWSPSLFYVLVKLYFWVFLSVFSSAWVHMCVHVYIYEIARELPVEQLESKDERWGDQQLEERGSGVHPWIDQVSRNSYRSGPCAWTSILINQARETGKSTLFISMWVLFVFTWVLEITTAIRSGGGRKTLLRPQASLRGTSHEREASFPNNHLYLL